MLILMRLSVRSQKNQNYFRVSFSLRNQESKDTVFSSVDYAKLNSAVANAFDIGVKGQKNAFCYCDT
jgi:hypothetical protein